MRNVLLALEEALKFHQQRIVPESWKVDMSVILESSSSDEEEEEIENDEEHEEKKHEVGHYCNLDN